MMDPSEQQIEVKSAPPMEFEQPPDATTIPETIDNRPLAERLIDKNWKTRMTAYEELKAGAERNEVEHAGETGEAFYAEYAAMLPKITSDSNAGALDAGYDAAVIFIDKAPIALSLQYADKLFSNAVEKALGARPSTQMKGRALLLKLMEIDECTACCQYLLSKLSDKKPKIPPACIDIIKEALGLFGIKALPVKDILKALPAVFNGSNGPAREAAMVLLVEMYRWIGQAPLQVLIDGMRSAQKSDFEKIIVDRADEFSANPVKPSLYLRKERSAAIAAAEESSISDGEAKGVGGAASTAAAIDAREFVDEVDIMKKLKGTEYNSLISQEKWSEQLKGLQIIIDAIGPTPKLKSGSDVHDIVQTCKGFLRQGHLQLQIASLKILQLFADGLRQEFASVLRPLMQQVILKSKEKRLVPEVQGTLNAAFTHCLHVDPCVDDIVEVIRNKKSPPHSKIGMIDVISSMLQHNPEKVSGDALKPIAEALISVAEDSDVKVREACTQGLIALGPVAKSKGRLASDTIKLLMGLEQSAPKVFKKIQAVGDGSAAKPSVASSPPRKTGASSKTNSASPGRVVPAVAKSTSSLPPRTGAAASTNTSNEGTKKSAVPSAATDDDNMDDLTLTAEEAEEALAALEIPGWNEGMIQNGMKSVKWQEKVESLSVIERHIGETKMGGRYSAALVKYLAVTSNSFKINNVSLLKATLQTITAIVQNVGTESFDRSAAWELIKAFSDKLADKKMKDLVGSLLTAFVECLGGTFVIKRMNNCIEKIKAPLAHQHYLDWVKQAIVDFGCGCFPVMVLTSFCQQQLENKNAGIRTAAVEVMGALHFQIGPKLQILAFSDDMKVQTKSLLEAEFAKVGHDPSTAAANITRTAPNSSSSDGSRGRKGNRATKSNVQTENNADEGSSKDQFSLDLPRQDLSSMLDKNIISELGFTDGKTSWQRRKAAMEAVISACVKSGHNIEMNKATVEIVKAFKPRMADTQANLKPIAASGIGHLVASFDPDSSGVKVLKVMSQSLLIGLTDNKKPMRDATVLALQNAVTASSGDENTIAHSGMMMSLIPAMTESLVNVVGRAELLAWMKRHLPALKGDCAEIVPSLVLCLQDKSSSVRVLSEEVLHFLMASGHLISRSCFDKATRDLAPASKRAIQSSMDRLFAAYGTAKGQQLPPPPEDTVQSKVPAIPQQKSSVPSMPEPSAAAVNAVLRGGGGSGSKAAAMAAAQAAVSSVEEDVLGRSTSADSSLQGSVDRTPGGTARWDLKRCAAGKTRKMDEFQKHGWPLPPSDPAEDEMRALRAVWEPMMTNDLVYLVFPKTSTGPANQAVFVPGMLQLVPQLQCPYFAQHQELVLKWCSVLLCLKQESTHGLEELLKFIIAVFKAIRENIDGGSVSRGMGMLSESELMCILPHLVDKAGHRYERQQALFKVAINAAAEIAPPNKITQILLNYGLKSSNKRSRCVALELIETMVQTSGAVALGPHGVRDVAAYLDVHDVDIVSRSVCLELLFVIYTTLGCDFTKLKRSFGTYVSEKSQLLLEEFILTKASRDLQEAPVSTGIASSSDDWEAMATAAAEASAKKKRSGDNLLLTLSEDDDMKIPLAAADSPHPTGKEVGRKGIVGGVQEMEMHRSMLQEIDNIIASTPKAIRTSVSNDSNDGLEELQQSLQQQQRRESASHHTFDATEDDKRHDHVGSPVSAEMEVVYKDIEEKIDALLSQPHAVADTDLRYEEAKDYLKMLHSIVNGDWSKESVPEDEEMILSRSETIILRLLKCVARSFDTPATVTKVAPDTSLGVDCSLLAISLSTLFALLKHKGVISSMSRTTMFEIFRECLHRICDVRITHPSASSSLSHTADSGSNGKECETTAGQVLHALNIVLLKVGHEGKADDVLGSLIRVLFCCLPPAELSSYPDYRPLPASSTKPTSRLVVNILGERTKLNDPYDDNEMDLQQLLVDIHDFFARYPRSTPDDTAFRTVKTILNELVQAKSGQRILQILQQTSIPRTDFVYALTCRLGHVDMVEATDPNLHQKIVTVIEAITSSRDKVAAIKELHRIKKANPQLDLNVHLMKISTAFRRYVLNTLTRLDANDENTENQPNAAQSNHISTTSAAASATHDTDDEVRKPVNSEPAVVPQTPPVTSTGKPKGSAEEALRILEGLKSRSNQKPVHAVPMETQEFGFDGSEREEVEQSPFARTSAKIRSSLSSLTASLDLPPPTGSASASKVSSGSAEAALSLEERIRRLKSQSAAGYNNRA